MSEMIERIARAICKANGRDPDAPRWIHYPGGHTSGICWHENIEPAKAAIEAMRIPTNEMEDAGYNESDMIDPYASRSTGTNAVAVYKAMIDAALAEP